MGQVESICGGGGSKDDAEDLKRKNSPSAVRPVNLDATTLDSSQVDTSSVTAQILSSDRDFEIHDKYKLLLIKHWPTIMDQKPDIFHKAMLFCIEASPKINEVIACGRYCFKDLTKWPKLNRICDAQLKFFQRLVMDYQLDPEKVKHESNLLGEKHRSYAHYGLKPHFLDLFQQQFTKQLVKIKVEDAAEKDGLISGWTVLMGYVIERTYYVYSMGDKSANSRHVSSSSAAAPCPD